MAVQSRGMSRRAVSRGALVAAAALIEPPQLRAQQTSPTRFRSVRVDVQPLVAIGGGAPAEVVARALPREMASMFANLLAPNDAGAPTLVARIDRIYLASYADAPGEGLDAFGNMDSMEGAGLVVAGRRTVATTPLRVTLPAGYSGAYYLPDIDVRRITSLCESFASWLRREMNL